jgi:hypothetical protein
MPSCRRGPTVRLAGACSGLPELVRPPSVAESPAGPPGVIALGCQPRDDQDSERAAIEQRSSSEDPMTYTSDRRQPGRAERLAAVLVRDGDLCVWCGRAFAGLVQPTTDHLVPRVKGGPSWIENEVAACRRCNSRRRHTTPLDWLDECERRGWSPTARHCRRRRGPCSRRSRHAAGSAAPPDTWMHNDGARARDER